MSHSWDRLLVITLVPQKQLTNFIQLEHACSFDSCPLPYHCCDKSMLVMNFFFVMTNNFLSWQNFGCDKHKFVVTTVLSWHTYMFVMTKHVFCRDKSRDKTFLSWETRICRNKSFVTTKIILSQQKFCCSKHTFVATKDTFCHDKHATKMILVAAPASDISPLFESGLAQGTKLASWRHQFYFTLALLFLCGSWTQSDFNFVPPQWMKTLKQPTMLPICMQKSMWGWQRSIRYGLSWLMDAVWFCLCSSSVNENVKMANTTAHLNAGVIVGVRV